MSRILLALCILMSLRVAGQTPVPMATQPMLTYLETFDSIATWGNNFTSGKGASRFSSVAPGGTAAIPDPTRITTSSSSFVTTQMSAGGLYKDSLNGKLIMLVTGTSNNTNSLAFDIHMDFSNANAGSLSFDWETVFNGTSTGNRAASLKVYASINGTTFTDLTAAQVNVTNFVAGGGTVGNIALPSFFNNSPTAILRFYYYNATGGSTGSRPALSIDNIRVTAQGNACTTPVASGSNLIFNNVTATSISGSFTAANPAPDGYMVVATSQGVLTSNPVDSTIYQIGDDIGDGIVVYQGTGLNFIASNLNPQTSYTFYVFSYNQYCTGALRYLVSSPLTGTQTTPAGPPCQTPTQAASTLTFSNVTTSSVKGSFSASPDATEYLVIASTNNSLTALPTHGMVYHPGDQLGGGEVIYRGGGTSFTAINLNHSTLYHFFVVALNNFACSNGPAYLTSPILSGQQSTNILFPCSSPTRLPSQLILQPDQNAITGFFTPSDAVTDAYLVISSTNNTLSSLPQNGTSYTIGSTLGGGTIVSSGKNFSFHTAGLLPSTTHYFFVFPYNEVCIGGPLYKTDSYLQNATTTTSAPALNYFFGNLHSHSSYSDGNQDDRTKTPYNNYDFAKNALCMDFLGISEHNHYTSNNNPGMTLAEYTQGLNDANNFNNANPGFLALYGMEWGTLTNGGHALVYGVDSLIGWETLNGVPNYNIFIPKNDFTSSGGLFKSVNAFSSSNAFTTLAHPSFNDYQQLAFAPYNAMADSAVVGVALESGPAFSANITYTEAGKNMEFLDYYLQLLAKGYRVAPLIDHDNHNMTFGRTANSRTAVIASSISKSDFMQAMRDMRFYATQDCNTKVNFKIYGQMMGSEIQHEYSPALTVTTENPPSSILPVIKIMYGVPGSGLAPVELTASNATSLSYTDVTLLPNTTAYYYADISYGSKRTITAPIWYTRLPDPIISQVEKKLSSGSVRLTRNPVGEWVELDINASRTGIAEIYIYSVSGQTFSTFARPVSAGSQHISLPVSLPAGMYILEVKIGTEKTREKFIHI